MLEVHNEEDLRKINDKFDLIGVNNRNLETFDTHLEKSFDLSNLIPDQFVKVSESGIKDPIHVEQLMDYGFEGFLVGEQFMHSSQPAQECSNFIKSIKPKTLV